MIAKKWAEEGLGHMSRYLSQIPISSVCPRLPKRVRQWIASPGMLPYIEIQRKGKGVRLLKQMTKWMFDASGSLSAGHNDDKRGAFQWTDVISKMSGHVVNGLYLCTFKPSSRKPRMDWSKIEFYRISDSKRRGKNRRKKCLVRSLDLKWNLVFLSSNLTLYGWLMPRGKTCHIFCCCKPPALDPSLVSHLLAPDDLLTELMAPSEHAGPGAWHLILFWLTVSPEGLNNKTKKESSWRKEICCTKCYSRPPG